MPKLCKNQYFLECNPKTDKFIHKYLYEEHREGDDYMDKNRFEIRIWSVREITDWQESGIQNISYLVSEVETYCSDNLSDVLHWLKSIGVSYATLNKYAPGGYSPHLFPSFFCIGLFPHVRVFANVYHNGYPMKFTQLPQTGMFSKIPDFTACGYRFKNTGRNHRVKRTHTRRNPTHRNIWGKDAAHSYVNAVECDDLKYDIPNRVLNKWKRKAIDYEYDFWDGKSRARSSKSWKSKKKQHQWE